MKSKVTNLVAGFQTSALCQFIDIPRLRSVQFTIPTRFLGYEKNCLVILERVHIP